MLHCMTLFHKKRNEAIWKRRTKASGSFIRVPCYDRTSLLYGSFRNIASMDWRSNVTKYARINRRKISNEKRFSKQIMFFGPVGTDYFITFTTNPKWPEIKLMLDLIGEKEVEMRPNISSRVFEIKLYELLDDIKKKNFFGQAMAVVYTIEFQQRGLPHAHILLFLHPNHKHPAASHVDKMISAEIPDSVKDPAGYNTVKNFMMHGLCGIANIESQCMKGGKCSKHFPKQYHDQTTVSDDGFPIYRRRQHGEVVTINGVKLDNRFVVPYNRDLIVKYQAHIDVELCSNARSIKYLFKYVHKGPDKAKFVIEKVNPDNANTSSSNACEGSGSSSNSCKDEIKKYLDCRYVSACEACWRIFEFDINYRFPSVQRLSFHLEGEQPVVFRESQSLKNVLDKPNITKTMFTEWMIANQLYSDARDLTYVEFPTKWVWHDKEKEWRRRKAQFSVEEKNWT